MLNDDLKLELFNTILFNLIGKINSILDDLFIHSRVKRHFKEIFNVANDLLGTFLGTFTAHEIL
jgi:hypothetical protein